MNELYHSCESVMTQMRLLHVPPISLCPLVGVRVCVSVCVCVYVCVVVCVYVNVFMRVRVISCVCERVVVWGCVRVYTIEDLHPGVYMTICICIYRCTHNEIHMTMHAYVMYMQPCTSNYLLDLGL